MSDIEKFSEALRKYGKQCFLNGRESMLTGEDVPTIPLREEVLRIYSEQSERLKVLEKRADDYYHQALADSRDPLRLEISRLSDRLDYIAAQFRELDALREARDDLRVLADDRLDYIAAVTAERDALREKVLTPAEADAALNAMSGLNFTFVAPQLRAKLTAIRASRSEEAGE